MSRRRGSDHALDDRRVRDILADAELLHSAVTTSRGPHLTPTAVSWEADRLWAVAPSDSVKIRALRRDPRIGLLLSVGDQHLVATGIARLLAPRDLPDHNRLGDLLRAPFGAARYLAENTRHTVGVVFDDPNPLRLIDRTGLSITLRRVALLRRDRLVESWGQWPGTALLEPRTSGPERFELPGQTPSWAGHLLAGDVDVQVGWRSVDGPLALPARWSAADQVADTSAQLLALAGALPTGPACLTRSVDSYKMSEKTGILLRGEGTAGHTTTGTATISITPSRVTHWRGKHAHTHAMTGAAL